MKTAILSNAETDLGATSLRDVERWASLATATALIAYAVSRRSVSGLCVAVAATPLLYRGWVGEWPRVANGDTPRDGTRVALAGERGIHVRESIRLEKPLAEVYRFWRRLENLPRFMSHLEQVSEGSDGRSHWVARGPAGVRLEWDAEIINEVENKVIAWRSLPGADIVTAGSVTFSTAREGRGSQLSVHLQYDPPAGRPGAWLATLIGREPSQTIREDLRRLKQQLEAGEIARATSQGQESRR